MQHFRDLLKLSYRPWYLLWMLFGSRWPVTLRFLAGPRLALRPGRDDRATLMEIFGERQYELPADCSIPEPKTIVDLGGYCGYSAVYFLNRFPGSQVIVFEPHPVHIRMLWKNIRLNNLQDRVRVVAAAVGVRDESGYLKDDNCTSTIVDAFQSAGAIPVPVVDLFSQIPSSQVDLLKMDAEGAEQAILADPRFLDLAKRISAMVLEWHHSASIPDGRSWCIDKLRQAGFDTVVDGPVQYSQAGILWAYRRA